MELQAIEFCEKNKTNIFRYIGEDTNFKNYVGMVTILEDMNCCAPTNTVLFAFVCDTKRKVMTSEEFMKFTKDLAIESSI